MRLRSSSDGSDGSNPASDETSLLEQSGRRRAGYTSVPATEPQAAATTTTTTTSWGSLPRKGQLAVIVFARLAEPLSERSLSSYLFYQLRWFDPALDASEIARQAGYLTAVFAAAQCLTSMWWGYAADSPRLGRKRVLVIGLTGTAMSALGMGFSRSLAAAFFFRFLAGALNGNVGVLRTMVSEVVVERRHQSRAFLLLPMCFNVGVIVGPLLSGFLADPVHSLPGLFGPGGSPFGGADGVRWMTKFPYALPNLVFAMVLLTAALAIILGLDETHPQLRHRPDSGRRLGQLIVRTLWRRKTDEREYTYDPIYNGYDIPSASESDRYLPHGDEEEIDDTPEMHASEPEDKRPQAPSLRGILTTNVCLTMLQRFLQSVHVSAFNSIFFSLLPTPRAEHTHFDLPFRFTGGLGLSSKKLGYANTTIGMIGLPLQLLLYPRLIGSLGVRTSYQVFLPLSIVAYFLLPYLVLLPPDDFVPIWTCLSTVLLMHVLSRTFVNPATMMLVNDCAPSPNLLGTVHGVASSISSAARIVGPTVGGLMLGWGLSHNLVGLPLWVLGIVAVVNWAVVWWIEDVQMSQ